MSRCTERALQCERRQPDSPRPLQDGLIHLKRSGSHPEGRGSGKFPTQGTQSHHSHRSKGGESAGDSARALRAPSCTHSEHAGSLWAQRCTRTRALGALCPPTVAGRLEPLQDKGEGGMTGKKAEQEAREALIFLGKAPPLEEEKEQLPG